MVKNNRGSAHIVLFLLMTTQVVNALFHVFFSFYFYDFSPGSITGVLLYLPVNYLIVLAAFDEGYIRNLKELSYCFIAGASTFILFELIGPEVIAFFLLLAPFYYVVINKMERNKSLFETNQ